MLKESHLFCLKATGTAMTFFIPELGFAGSIIFSTKAIFVVVRTYSLHLYLEKLPIREENFYA